MRLRHWSELGAWTLGLVLCALYVAARTGLELARVAGIDAARESRNTAFSGSLANSSLDTRAVGRIDQTLWSKRRIAAFAASLTMPGKPEGLLRIPSIDLEVPVYRGASEINLNRGAAHIEGTAALSDSGNIGIAGHRDGFFRKLQDITIDGEVELIAGERTLRYRVTEILIVPPSARSILDTTAVPSITLVTCYPFYFVGNAPLRYVVRAELGRGEYQPGNEPKERIAAIPSTR